MLNLALFSLVFLFAVSMFDLSFTYSGVSRAFTSLGKGVAETSTKVIDEDGYPLVAPYFVVETFERKSYEHFNVSLKKIRVAQDYTLKFHYYRDNDLTKENRQEPNVATLEFHCPLGVYGNYDNSVTYSIIRGYHYGE